MFRKTIIALTTALIMGLTNPQALSHHHELDRRAVEGVNKTRFKTGPCVEGDKIDGRTILEPLLKITKEDEDPFYLYSTRTVPAGRLQYQEVRAVYNTEDDRYIVENLKVNMVSDHTATDTFKSLRILRMSEYVYDALGWEDSEAGNSGCVSTVAQGGFIHAQRTDKLSFTLSVNPQRLDNYIYEDGIVYFVVELTYFTGIAPGGGRQEEKVIDAHGEKTVVVVSALKGGSYSTRVIYFPFGVNINPEAAPSAPSSPYKQKLTTMWGTLKE